MADKATELPLAGGCQCGAVRYELKSHPNRTYVCHCTECRKQSASAFGITLNVNRDAFFLLKGTTSIWSRETDSGNSLDCHFCPVCGTRVWHESGPDTETVSIKGGSLDAGPDLSAGIHIWTSRKLPDVIIPDGAVQMPGEPD